MGKAGGHELSIQVSKLKFILLKKKKKKKKKKKFQYYSNLNTSFNTIPNIKRMKGCAIKKEHGNVEGHRLTTEILLLTSGTQCCEQMPHEYCKAVSQSCVSQGKKKKEANV